MKKYLHLLLFSAALSIGFSTSSFAQDVMQPPKTELNAATINDDVIPVINAEENSAAIDTNAITHPPLRMTPDKSEIVKLSNNIGSVIIGNPAHLNIFVDSAKMLVIVPRLPGASFFTVLDENGDVIMQRHVIVGSPKEKYVRIRRTCGDGDCQATSVYYCPDMCHEIMLSTDGETQGQGSDELSEGGSNNAGGSPTSPSAIEGQ